MAGQLLVKIKTLEEHPANFIIEGSGVDTWYNRDKCRGMCYRVSDLGSNCGFYMTISGETPANFALRKEHVVVVEESADI